MLKLKQIWLLVPDNEVCRNWCGGSALLELPPLFRIPTWFDVQNIVGFGLSLVLEILLIVYKMSCVKKANKQTTPPIANRKQVTIKTKEVFVTALNCFSDPVCSAVVLGQLNYNWRQENQELC